MALTGSLREVEPADVLQLISMARKTGVLTIASRQDRVHVYFRDGQPVHATCGAATGEEAIYALLPRSEGDFSFEPSPIDCPVTITADVQSVMLEGVRRMDHIRLLKGDLPSGDTVLEVAPGSPAETGHASDDGGLSAAERALLALVNGQRTVVELVQASGLPEIDAHQALHQLISQGRVVAQEPGAAGAAGGLAGIGPDAGVMAANASGPSAEDIQRLLERVASL
jgi:hypothetical protein